MIVVGLGSMGAAAAYRLASRGLRVLAFDRFDPPHDRGAHSGGSRIIRMAYMEGADYVPLVRRSYELWRELESDASEPLLTATGGLMLGRPDSVAVAGSAAAARAHGLAHELLDASEVRRRFPPFTPSEDEIALYEEVAGLVRPDRAIAAYLRLARMAGATLHTDIGVDDWSATTDGVSVTTAEGTVHGERLILCPGAWAPTLTRLRVPMQVQRRVQHYWHPSDPGAFDPGTFPIWVWEYGSGLAAYGLPALDGAVKAGFHDGDEAVDPDVGAAPAESTEAEAMRSWMSNRLPDLATANWLRGRTCLYTLTPDQHFVLGLHPDSPNVAVACGFSGHGFKFAPVIGEILADLVTTGSTTHSIGLFDPKRFG